jgi:G:T-mismatch repair DNA endonuclease (very short patch repair protein)
MAHFFRWRGKSQVDSNLPKANTYFRFAKITSNLPKANTYFRFAKITSNLPKANTYFRFAKITKSCLFVDEPFASFDRSGFFDFRGDVYHQVSGTR